MKLRQLESLGIAGDLPAAERAAALVRLLVLRFRCDTGHRDLETVVESRWMSGVNECFRLLREVYRGPPGRGVAFGVSWPFLRAGGRLVAPALPVALGMGEASGPDGSYRLSDDVVWREAVGEAQPLLSCAEGAASPEAGFDLLWFGNSERYLVRAGTLEIEDLFSVLRLPATPRLATQLLIRGQRADPGAIEGVPLSERRGLAEVEVRRRRELIPGDRWRDPQQVLAGRADISRLERSGDQLLADTRLGDRVVFNLVEEPRGWRVYVWEGSYPFRTMSITDHGSSVSLSGTLSPTLDPLSPGLRSRLAFDLQSNLIALAGS